MFTENETLGDKPEQMGEKKESTSVPTGSSSFWFSLAS